MHHTTSKLFSSQRGSAYLVVMFAVMVMSIGITAAAKQWKGVMQREKEADLLIRGIEIQTAIGNYSKARQLGSLVPGEKYPLTLEELTKGPKPFLRKIYKDPITGEDWEYVRDPGGGGGIRGVRSKSKATAFKQHQFPPVVAHFDGLTQYNDWVFQPPAALMAPGQLPTPPGLLPPPGQTPSGSTPPQLPNPAPAPPAVPAPVQ